MTMELWSSHWKSDWFVGVSSTWLESEFLLWAAVGEKTVAFADQRCAVNWLPAGMLMWMACKKKKQITETAVTFICWKICFLPLTAITEFLLWTWLFSRYSRTMQYFRHYLWHTLYLLTELTVIWCYETCKKRFNKMWSNLKRLSCSFSSFWTLFQKHFLKNGLFWSPVRWPFAAVSLVIVNSSLRPDRNAEPQSGVDQVTTEQSFFLNASIYPWGPPPSPKPSLCPGLWQHTGG